MEEKIWNTSFIGVFFISAANALGHHMMNVLAALYADSFGAGATIVGLATSAFAYTALALRFVSSPAIDAFNRKRILNGSVLVTAAAFFLYATAPNVAFLIIARLVHGVSTAFMSSCTLTMAADALPPRKMNSGIGFFSLAQAICMAIGPACGMAMVGAIGFSATFTATGFFMIAAFVVSLFLKEKPHPRRPFKITLGNAFAREAALPAIVAGLLALSFSNINSFLALCAAERGVENIGLFFTVDALLMLLSRPITGGLADRHGLMKVILPCIVCFAASLVIICIAHSLWMFLVAAALCAFGYGATGPMLQTACVESVPPERRGAGSGAYYIGLDTGTLIGPVAAGAIVSSSNYETMWISLIVPIAIAFALLFVFRSTIKAIEDRQSKIAESLK